MHRNESTPDRIIRAILGAALVVLAFAAFDVTAGAWLGIVAAVLGGVLLFTAATGFCAIYALLGKKTCKAC